MNLVVGLVDPEDPESQFATDRQQLATPAVTLASAGESHRCYNVAGCANALSSLKTRRTSSSW